MQEEIDLYDKFIPIFSKMLAQLVDVDSYVAAVQPLLSDGDIIADCLETDEIPGEDDDSEEMEVDSVPPYFLCIQMRVTRFKKTATRYRQILRRISNDPKKLLSTIFSLPLSSYCRGMVVYVSLNISIHPCLKLTCPPPPSLFLYTFENRNFQRSPTIREGKVGNV